MFKNLSRTYVISEIGINHQGDMNVARDMIKASKEAGADCVKLQKRDIDLVYTLNELNSQRPSKWGTTFREQKRGLEFDKDQYNQLQHFAHNQGLDFTASPWDVNSIDMLYDMSVPFLKIPSALATNKAYLRHCATTNLPLILSTGMCDARMINAIVWFLEDCQANLEVIMHCQSVYPTKPEDANLLGIQTLKEQFSRYQYVLGHSGHDELVMTSALAVALGARVIERHLTLDKNSEGTDQKASLEPDEFAEMVRKVRITETCLGDGKLIIQPDEKPIATKLRKVNDFTAPGDHE